MSLRHCLSAVLALLAALTVTSAAAAQDAVSGGGAPADFGPGWILTPALGFMSTYDDNITLFGRGTADEQNNDLINAYAPQADLTYRGRRTHFGASYAGSFLNYQTFSMFNHWQQRAQLDMRRELTQRFQISADASASRSPSTETVDLVGIPFSLTGTRVFSWRVGSGYSLTARDGISASVQYQNVRFDRPEDLRYYLRGGQVFEMSSGYRRRLNARLGAGATYGYRRASVVDELEAFDLHTTRAAVDYQASQNWSIHGNAGVVFLSATATTESRRAPAFGASADWSGQTSAFSVSYDRSLMPSFGYGGTVRSQDLGASFRTALSRHVYTSHSVRFRDSDPLFPGPTQSRLRSLRTNSTIGWTPRQWVRLEAFYARTAQTSLQPGGRVDRNRIGFQIVTSKPMRMQ